MEKTTWKIGELARQSGITVRTLHHYHQIGLLVPSEFTESGHRLYTNADIAKLQQILSLKQMGLSLDEIQSFIEKPNYNPILVVKTQLESITEQIDKMKAINNGLTDEQKAEMKKQWDNFISRLKKHTEDNTPTNDPSVKELALHWKAVTASFTGNDPEITRVGERFHAENPNNPLSFGLTSEMYQYLRTAIEKL